MAERRGEGGGRSWTAQDRPRRVESAFRWYGEEGWAVRLREPANTLLNQAGGRIFELLDGRHTVGQIARILCQEFDVEPETARRDLEEFLDQLRANEMLA